MLRNSALALLAAVLTGCAAAGTGTGGNQDVLTRAQIEESGQVTAYELIQVERPHWLRIRGSTSFTKEPVIPVYIDGVRAGEVDMLRNISTNDIREIRHYDARRAQFEFGSGHVHGAIEVITRG